jgi:inosine/xanthosine triphosphatase
MIIAVGSQNPVKIEAVRLAFERLWPAERWQVQGCVANSGVTAQPMTDTEACCGARARAASALKQLNAAYGVGLEGGLQKVDQYWFNCGWAAVSDRAGSEGIGTTIRMVVPERLMRIVLSGKELGEACDEVFQSRNTKQAEGHFGLMTKNAIDRTTAFRDAVIAALAPFISPGVME